MHLLNLNNYLKFSITIKNLFNFLLFLFNLKLFNCAIVLKCILGKTISFLYDIYELKLLSIEIIFLLLVIFLTKTLIY